MIVIFVVISGFRFAELPCAAQHSSSYTIGGSTTGDPSELEKNWRPIMQDYLNKAVGAKYSPPINFTFIAVEYSSSTLLADLYEEGKIDFVCKKRSFFFLKSQELIQGFFDH